MKLKKNPKSDLSRNRSLFFITGLMLVLALSYLALEWKTYDDNEYISLCKGMNYHNDLAEEATLIEIPKVIPPKPVVSQIIEIIEDIDEEVESVIESTETNQEDEILEIEDIASPEEILDIDIPLPLLDEKPVFPGCENEKDKIACFQTKIQKHIGSNFRYPEKDKNVGTRGRISVMFTIQKDGSVGNIRMRGPSENLEKEARRVIMKLPKMKPGKQDGKAVRVPFSIPINITLQ